MGQIFLAVSSSLRDREAIRGLDVGLTQICRLLLEIISSQEFKSLLFHVPLQVNRQTSIA